MSDNKNEDVNPKKFRKTKTFIYHVTGLSDVFFIKKILSDVVGEQKKRFSLLKGQYDDFRSQDGKEDYSNKNYSDFVVSPEKEQELLQALKSAKRRWLVLLVILGVVAVASAVVCLSTLFVSNLPFSVYLKSWGMFVLVLLFGGYIFIKSMINEFLAWQIANKRHSSKEGGSFRSFKNTDWVWQTLNFKQCGKQEENENINL
ncbi:hypothetical protein [Photorhabdus asymbiotica]|uniref:hypothetical protein n=1 Tax=Photorhabdus asymbiotica TaxID=291112 RepID=UPI003DA71980